MPTYDYLCQNCNQKFDVFLSYSEYGKKTVLCTNCGSDKVKRRLNRVRIAKSEESRMESMESMVGGMGNLEGLENDPQALGQMMRKMGKEMGEEMPAEFDEVVDRLESGQSPEDIESALPDLGSGEAGGVDDL
jgi:putative FmdB family regulatory protein